jgi:paraquat-inducible protein B
MDKLPNEKIASGTIRRQRVSAIWLVPIMAILATAWLGYRVVSERGPRIEISFQSAEGLEVGKTKIKHRDIELGVVETLVPNEGLSSVTIGARMNRYAEPHLKTGTKFWVVRPRLSAEGISGLGTIFSGSYIEMSPGNGESARKFSALEDPPVVEADVPGTDFVLRAKRAGSISQGAPVSHHGVKVGEVLEFQLSPDTGDSTIRIFIRAPHDHLVHEGTRFWNASGITVELASEGLKLRTESLQSILTGGITFDVPVGGEPGPIARTDSTFTLYADQERAKEALYTSKIPFLINLIGSAQGLNIGSEVRMRGIRVGEIIDLRMELDIATQEFLIPAVIEIEPQRIKPRNIQAMPEDVHSGAFQQAAYGIFDILIAKGLRARVASGSLLTGQKYISLDFVPNARPVKLATKEKYPAIPMVESVDLDAVMKSADDVLTGLVTTVSTLNSLIGSPEMARSLKSLDRTLASVDHAAAGASKEVGPLLVALKAATISADAAIKEAATTLKKTGQILAGDGMSNNSASSLLSELRQSAHSLHVLVDYLEKNPSSVVWGKPKGTR